MAKVKKTPPHTPDPLVKEAEAMAKEERAKRYNKRKNNRSLHTWEPEPRDPNKPPTKAGKYSK